MAAGPWSSRFVGSHFFLPEPKADNEAWETIPPSWNGIRFDAIDVLFVSPFFLKADDDSSFVLGDGSNLNARFEWVVRAARSKNPNIKIILEQFYHDEPETDYRAFHGDQGKIQRYAESVAAFIGEWHNKTLPALTGDGQVSARIDGFDVDVESSTKEADLPKVLAAVRATLGALASRLNGPPFSVSITPAWTDFLDESIPSSCDYVNMQNYSGGVYTFAENYLNAVHGLRKEQLVWGFASEQPWRNSLTSFSQAREKVLEVVNGQTVGVYTWRINSDNYVYENIFQVWMYNLVHGVTLPDSREERIIEKYWPFGGRTGENGPLILPQDLN
ncbi:hypothetical protein LY78DRAFT_663392 [Colletotrichum sublineola]|nr:hypothetical protein LY78DRAFT_663392 [Colletotrichum sublineola]